MKTIKVDKVILYYMDRVDPDGNLYRFYVYKGMASENDDVFYYCNGIESFKQLAEYGVGEFIVTFCWSFF